MPRIYENDGASPLKPGDVDGMEEWLLEDDGPTWDLLTGKPPHTGNLPHPELASSGKPSLADAAVVSQLVRRFLADVCKRVAAVGDGSLDRDAAVRADMQACRDAAVIFLGQNPAYESVGQWNTGGGMVGWMLHTLGHVYREPEAEADRERIVADVFAWAARFAYEAISAHENDDDEGDLQDDLSNIADDLARFLLGNLGPFEDRLSL